ncbi:hypothetical protein BKA67DRAFT_650521 [Truncatella angustata]|uniref:Uncharacterized protein n=1 Tax=Truncatella angustata TaxID=152316 RepID=A0A9P8RHB1_9PEZI|nr:uncharacterized protein BKA67DRAFT_650521 [Truncatella angustata]KAH6645837.1 hypothetical protein BKA67DRAFT_650521 [Truncatella angustata]
MSRVSEMDTSTMRAMERVISGLWVLLGAGAINESQHSKILRLLGSNEDSLPADKIDNTYNKTTQVSAPIAHATTFELVNTQLGNASVPRLPSVSLIRWDMPPLSATPTIIPRQAETKPLSQKQYNTLSKGERKALSTVTTAIKPFLGNEPLNYEVNICAAHARDLSSTIPRFLLLTESISHHNTCLLSHDTKEQMKPLGNPSKRLDQKGHVSDMPERKVLPSHKDSDHGSGRKDHEMTNTSQNPASAPEERFKNHQTSVREQELGMGVFGDGGTSSSSGATMVGNHAAANVSDVTDAATNEGTETRAGDPTPPRPAPSLTHHHMPSSRSSSALPHRNKYHRRDPPFPLHTNPRLSHVPADEIYYV